MDSKSKEEHLVGKLIGPVDVSNSKEVTYWLQKYMDDHGKPPQVIAVNPNAPEFTLPEKFEGLGCTILRRQYIHHPQVVIVGILE